VKGQSGNPGGRPKVEGEIRELARQHTMTALRTLIEIAEQGENESARVTATNALLDRGGAGTTLSEPNRGDSVDLSLGIFKLTH
jgi:hypothetical protein